MVCWRPPADPLRFMGASPRLVEFSFGNTDRIAPWVPLFSLWRLRYQRLCASGASRVHNAGANAGVYKMRLIIALLGLTALVSANATTRTCTGHGVELQVLGSGGPALEDQRASSRSLSWQDGRPRVLVDSGGGSALRFGQAGAHVAQLDVILFTHLHIDH